MALGALERIQRVRSPRYASSCRGDRRVGLAQQLESRGRTVGVLFIYLYVGLCVIPCPVAEVFSFFGVATQRLLVCCVLASFCLTDTIITEPRIARTTKDGLPNEEQAVTRLVQMVNSLSPEHKARLPLLTPLAGGTVEEGFVMARLRGETHFALRILGRTQQEGSLVRATIGKREFWAILQSVSPKTATAEVKIRSSPVVLPMSAIRAFDAALYLKPSEFKKLEILDSEVFVENELYFHFSLLFRKREILLGWWFRFRKGGR